MDLRFLSVLSAKASGLDYGRGAALMQPAVQLENSAVQASATWLPDPDLALMLPIFWQYL